MNTSEVRWLLLIHQIPPKPGYFRVKIWRRLQRLGAVAVKNSVYVLPKNEQTQEDLQWVLREIVEGGGEASVCEAHFVDGLSDDELESLFNAAREADYAQIAEEARQAMDALSSASEVDADSRVKTNAALSRLQRRLSEIAAIDFFEAPGREAAQGLISGLEARLRDKAPEQRAVHAAPIGRKELTGRAWVTRKGIHVDRMASAWFIRRFVDAEARFKFVSGKGYQPEPDELRFDMFDGDFTHEGDRCTLEVLIERLGLDDPALIPIAEIVHEIDLKDSKYDRPETPGIDRLIAGIAMAHKSDEERLERGVALFDDLYEYFKRKRN